MLPRRRIVDESLTCYYHVFSRCVRRLFLFDEEEHPERKPWIAERLQLLASIFAVDVLPFSWMDNHFHLVLRLDSPRVDTWTDDEVIARWARLCPPKAKTKGGPAPETGPGSEYHALRINDHAWLAKARKRLADLGWFMKALKEPLARWVNQNEKCTGAFFEGRYKSVALVGQDAVVAAMAYVDLNPFAAGKGPRPETTPHTSLFARWLNLVHQKADAALIAADANDRTYEGMRDSLEGVLATIAAEREFWLFPIHDERQHHGEKRPGVSDALDLPTYYRIVDALARTTREGKASLDPEAASIFERLRLDGGWLLETVRRFRKLADRGTFGRVLGTVEALKTVAGAMKALAERWLGTPREIPAPS